MNINFDENLLRWAVQIEDEVNCDIQAGLDLGQNLEKYIAKTQAHINQEKLMSVLQEELGNILSSEDLEIIADVTQNCVRDRLKEKYRSIEVA